MFLVPRPSLSNLPPEHRPRTAVLSDIYNMNFQQAWAGPIRVHMGAFIFCQTSASNETATLHQRVAAVLERIRPAIQSDGGDMELVEITEGNVVRIRLLGACVGCPSSTITLQMGIERNLKEKVPEVVAVEQVH